ncbi:Gamma-aminobutyric acid type B receptor subunit 1 [Lucilia cuprina]|nr:Gamma-aminobutyric acid type B receptor subunit 1 [Lucilia cuprina]
MRRKHPDLNFRLTSLNVKSSFVVLMFLSVLLRMSIAVVYNNNSNGEKLKANLYNYQCFTDKDRIHPILRTYDELSQLVFSDIIKSRLTGKAQEIIEINTQVQSWDEIKTVLQNNSEKKNHASKLTTVDFYNDIKYRLRRLNNKAAMVLGEGEAANQVAINNQRSALHIFKNKMPEPMRTVLACRNPNSLESAMDILFENGYDKMGKDGHMVNFKNKQIGQRSQDQPTQGIKSSSNNYKKNNNNYNRDNYHSRNINRNAQGNNQYRREDNYHQNNQETNNQNCQAQQPTESRKLIQLKFSANNTSPNLSFRQSTIGIQVSYWPSHQIITRIFAIFLRDVLHYKNVYILPIEFNGNPEEDYYEGKRLSNTLDLLIKHPQYPNLPMINLGVWTPPMGHGLRPMEVYESGVSLDPSRFGWFVGPEVNFTMEGLHYSVFLNRSNPFYEQYVMDEDELQELTQGNEYEYFVSPMCENIQCATLLAEYKMETSFVQNQIKEMNGYLNILWLGSRFRSEIDRLYLKYIDYNSSGNSKRFLVLHWNPSDVIDGRHKFEHIELPLCEESLSLWKSYCKYELTPIFKYHSKHLLADERLMHSLRLFWINNDDLMQLFSDLDQKRSEKGFVADVMYNELACDWLRNHTETYNLWISNEPMTLSIGAIFPIKKNTRGHQNLVYAVKRAVQAVNSNSTILRNYNLNVIENDGECKADVVMKSFIHLFNVPKLLGVVGPACSETVEPIAGISRHTNMAVISYSAEGATFLDRHAYPFFFRTIGSNRQYEDVYISLMKKIGWKRVAALTEDGQKYTEYISHMETTLKNNNMELIINKKFLSDITHVEMNKYLVDLKNRRARIIIADIHNKYAQMALCEAYKLKRLSKDWNIVSEESNHSCTNQELEMAFEGHFSIMHSPFGGNATIMQEHITIEKWLESYSANVSSVSKYTAFAYDAVWAFALAADKLLHENRGAVENLRSKTVVNRFADLIWETDFVGLSGRVRFGQGGSRITELIIRQWRNRQSVEVGKYIPQLVGKGRNLRTSGGNFVLNESAIVWYFEGKPPGDECHNSIHRTALYDCRCAHIAYILLFLETTIRRKTETFC